VLCLQPRFLAGGQVSADSRCKTIALALLLLRRNARLSSLACLPLPARAESRSLPQPCPLPARSGGVERSVLLWQPKGNVTRAVGELSGHSAGVQQLVVADEQSQVGVVAGRRDAAECGCPLVFLGCWSAGGAPAH
jgi:hypothetical protein